jgi:hypothetical protein
VKGAACETAGAALAEGGFACILADERTLGFRAAGLAVTTRGASTVTGGRFWPAVCAFVVEGIASSAPQSTSKLVPPRARLRNMAFLTPARWPAC